MSFNKTLANLLAVKFTVKPSTRNIFITLNSQGGALIKDLLYLSLRDYILILPCDGVLELSLLPVTVRNSTSRFVSPVL